MFGGKVRWLHQKNQQRDDHLGLGVRSLMTRRQRGPCEGNSHGPKQSGLWTVRRWRHEDRQLHSKG